MQYAARLYVPMSRGCAPMQAFDELKVDCYGLYRLPSRCRRGEFPTREEIMIREPFIKCEMEDYDWRHEGARLKLECTVCTIRPDQMLTIIVGHPSNSQEYNPLTAGTPIDDPQNVSATVLAAVPPELRRTCMRVRHIEVHVKRGDREQYGFHMVDDNHYKVTPLVMQKHALQSHVMKVTQADELLLSFEDGELHVSKPR